MGFLFVNTEELTALQGLSYIQQVTYLLGIRPYMDRKSFIVGIKRRISYQSLQEMLYVEPHQGVKSAGSPSRQQVRRIIKSLQRAGLLEIKSVGKQLILKCSLANSDISAQNKPDTKPTHQPDTVAKQKKPTTSVDYDDRNQYADISETANADTPHNSENYYFFLGKNFKKFWSLYPVKTGKQKAWEEFQRLQPDDSLVRTIFTALNHQINAVQQLHAHGLWMPNWNSPANWLQHHRWEDEIDLTLIKEKNNNAKHARGSAKQPPYDLLWESCKGGADFDFDAEEPNPENHNNVIAFTKPRV